MRYVFCLLILSVLLSAQAMSSENPYLKCKGKPFRDYSARLHEDYYYMAFKDSADVVVANIRQAAHEFGGREWALEVKFAECSKKYADAYKVGFPEDGYTADNFISDLAQIEKKAARLKTPYLQLRTLYRMMQLHYYDIQNYELAFQDAIRIDKLLDRVSAEEFPPKPHYYLNIANLYLFFREYDSAVKYFEKITGNTQTAYMSNSLEAAYNGLGLIYRDHYKDTKKSDSYFNKILQVEAQPQFDKGCNIRHSMWEGIAKGNLANNAYLRGDYEAAVPLLEFSMRRMVEHQDYNYASGKTELLADIYIKKGDLSKAKHYIDLTQQYTANGNDPYSLLSSYYAAKGDYKEAMTYADSAAVELARHNEEFSALKLYRAEQRVKQEELELEQLRSKSYRRGAIMLSVGLGLISLLSLLLYYFYRRKRAAYHELVRKSQQWAKLPVNSMCQAATPEPADTALMKRISEVMEENKIYKNSELTIDALADAVGDKRHIVSQAINRCTGSNFKSYINEFRVKEAIRLLSDPEADKLTIDGVALDAGFNDRKTFYKVFKRATGLSPSEFRNNITKE